MGSRAQRRKERHEQKRAEKRKKVREARERRPVVLHSPIAIGSNSRHRERLQQQVPTAWVGEDPFDVALFDDAAVASLSTELFAQVTSIRSALAQATERRGDEALQSVAGIPRSSPLSDWRLFIRGLVEWLADDHQAAAATWERLAPERRPGRIAMAMILALRTDLDQEAGAAAASPPAGTGDPLQAPRWSSADSQSMYHARLLRRIRFDRAALKVAESALNQPEEVPELLFGPRKIEWMRRFIAEYGDTEPDLTRALAETGLIRAFHQRYTDLFDEAATALPGPRHDPRNLLRRFHFYTDPEDQGSDALANQALAKYLDHDLPSNESISAPLRQAIISQIHLCEAISLQQTVQRNFFGRHFMPPEDSKGVRSHYKASIKADPSHRAAYRRYAGWIEVKLQDPELLKKKQEQLEHELADVMRLWSEGLPDEVRPRLWLVDHLLENDSLEEARPHVEFLAASRHDDPEVRALPWKWQLLEALHLCRRKGTLAEARDRLDEAERLWPSWLGKEWLPYLRAAWLLRSGQTEAFAARRETLCEEAGITRNSLADACLMLGAAQKMQLPAVGLKQFRTPIERALKYLQSIPVEELIQAGAVFWDLHRAKLLYPAYRMHGGKFGKALIDAWKRSPQSVIKTWENERTRKAVLWSGANRFWSAAFEEKLPAFYSHPRIGRHPTFVAAKVNAFLNRAHHWRAREFLDCVPILRDAAREERDAYLRHWFGTLADRLDELIPSGDTDRFGFPFDFGSPGPTGEGHFGEQFELPFDNPWFESQDEGDDSENSPPGERSSASSTRPR